jgi:hypothetical protein
MTNCIRTDNTYKYWNNPIKMECRIPFIHQNVIKYWVITYKTIKMECIITDNLQLVIGV